MSKVDSLAVRLIQFWTMTPKTRLASWLWAIIPSWWTIAKIAPFAFALWSLDILSRGDMGNGKTIVAITLMVCGFLASFGIMLFHDKVQKDEEQTKRTLEKWEEEEQKKK